MKIPKQYYAPLVLLLIAGAIFAWGALTLDISNTATVVVNAKNLAVDIIASTSTCPVYGSNAYSLSNSTISLTWPTVNEPGSSGFLFCLENVGSSTSVTFTQGTVTPSPSPGTLTTSPTGPVSIAAKGVTPIPTTLTATIGVPDTTYTFTLTIA